MIRTEQVPIPLIFNSLKHYLPAIKEYLEKNISKTQGTDIPALIKDLKHIGNSVMDIYKGNLFEKDIFNEVITFIQNENLGTREHFMKWAGEGYTDFRKILLSDGSVWVLKYLNQKSRFIHIFPAKSSPHTIRVKANTLKSAILYHVIAGNDYVTVENLNRVRIITGLSPVGEINKAAAVAEMIEILRY
jgi:hypothetical protein